MHANEAAIKAFCEQFDPPLRYIHTQRVNEQPVDNAYMAAFWDAKQSLGVTAIAHSGKVHTIIESHGRLDAAAEIGRNIAFSFGMTSKEQPQ